MDSISGQLDVWRASVSAMIDTLLANLPNLLAGLAFLILGWLVARMVRNLVHRFGHGINTLLERIMRRGSLARVRLSESALHAVGTVTYWVVVVYFAAAAARIAHLEGVAAWLDSIVKYVPSMLAGALIIVVGYVISTLVRDIVASNMSSEGSAQARVAASVAQGATFLIAVVIGVEQIGIDATFLIVIVSIILGGMFLSLAIAFGLGARVLVSNLIAASELKRHYRPGQRVRMGAVDGEVLELTGTSIVVETDEGRVNVPAKAFLERSTVLRVPQE